MAEIWLMLLGADFETESSLHLGPTNVVVVHDWASARRGNSGNGGEAA
jgi:aminoglycoside N3'-acetyltransferase